MVGTAHFNAVMEAARNCIRAETVHQRYQCVQALDRAVTAYDRAAYERKALSSVRKMTVMDRLGLPRA